MVPPYRCGNGNTTSPAPSNPSISLCSSFHWEGSITEKFRSPLACFVKSKIKSHLFSSASNKICSATYLFSNWHLLRVAFAQGRSGCKGQIPSCLSSQLQGRWLHTSISSFCTSHGIWTESMPHGLCSLSSLWRRWTLRWVRCKTWCWRTYPPISSTDGQLFRTYLLGMIEQAHRARI